MEKPDFSNFFSICIGFIGVCGVINSNIIRTNTEDIVLSTIVLLLSFVIFVLAFVFADIHKIRTSLEEGDNGTN